MAIALLNKLPSNVQKRFYENYSGTSTFAKTCVLPDMWRLKKLSTVFHYVDAKPPLVLYPFLNHNTAAWHFDNKPYASNSASKLLCHHYEPNKVVTAISAMKSALSKTSQSDITTRGLHDGFLGHYVGDAHQPLHTMSAVDTFCHQEQGGNQFCLGKKNSRGKCANNLHHL